jgi:hypothetical protein
VAKQEVEVLQQQVPVGLLVQVEAVHLVVLEPEEVALQEVLEPEEVALQEVLEPAEVALQEVLEQAVMASLAPVVEA